MSYIGTDVIDEIDVDVWNGCLHVKEQDLRLNATYYFTRTCTIAGVTLITCHTISRVTAILYLHYATRKKYMFKLNFVNFTSCLLVKIKMDSSNDFNRSCLFYYGKFEINFSRGSTHENFYLQYLAGGQLVKMNSKFSHFVFACRVLHAAVATCYSEQLLH